MRLIFELKFSYLKISRSKRVIEVQDCNLKIEEVGDGNIAITNNCRELNSTILYKHLLLEVESHHTFIADA